MKVINILIIVILFDISIAFSQSPITISINTKVPGRIIPSDFTGHSFEMLAMRKNYGGVNGYLFDSTDTQMLTLFRNLGIKNLRMGGSSSDTNSLGYHPSFGDIDALFRFVKAANVKVIYSLRLQNGNPSIDASAAKYVWDNYKQYIDCFAIGNEPDNYFRDTVIHDYSTFIPRWRHFVSVISAAVPEAKFGGPDNATDGSAWAVNFAKDEKKSGIVTSIFPHYYVGHSAKNKTPQEIIDELLSPSWDTVNYPTRYNEFAGTVDSLGYPYRFTEANSFFVPVPGVKGGNNCFATALFALDFMHWWAEHGASGVDFHTTEWKLNGTFHLGSKGLNIYPMGYGIKAFDIGGHGRVDTVSITNPNKLNVTAYAVSDSNGLYVTIINKEHNAGERTAKVNIKPNNILGKAEVIYLKAKKGITDTSNVTIGGLSISNSSNWKGAWQPVKLIDAKSNSYIVTVPVSTAAIVKIYNIANTNNH